MVPARDPALFRKSDAVTVASSSVSYRSACIQESHDKLATRSAELQFSAVTFCRKYCPQKLCLPVSSTLNNALFSVLAREFAAYFMAICTLKLTLWYINCSFKMFAEYLYF